MWKSVQNARELDGGSILSSVLPNQTLTLPKNQQLLNIQFYSQSKHHISLNSSYKIPKEIISWMVHLTERNVKHYYEQNTELGWNSDTKLREFQSKLAMFLIVYSSINNNPLAFIHYRYLIENKNAVLYLYELQIEESMQNCGLGMKLMQIVVQIAKESAMKKVMLTVCNSNENAIYLYKVKLGFTVDEYSPKYSEEFGYQILSKIV
uniref:N-alpha-acetyltransferase 40 n=1 Tax=Timspurckia oligopyrenoides TaxID=708627 RepID=A0A7S1ETR9_9RHOD|mmetsp:Transcript_6676/g.11921  ORF Transcript_6676/g.11921 Transcript_6676/m.11921 type:complete len:207 (+) Transcript_6676:204-824(+)